MKMNTPLFSIITITYNSEKTIERTLKSILCQGFSNYEYIIVDGASKDGTIDIVKRYESLFEGRMKWVSEPDSGIYNAMNKGILRSCGIYIGIVNSDDWLANDALQMVADEIALDNDNYNKIMTGEILFHYEDGDAQLFPTSFEHYEYYSKRYRMGLNHPATFVPRCIYNQIGVFDERFRLYGDADFIIRCYESGVGVRFIHKVLSNMADGGASNRRSRLVLNDSLLKYKKHCKSKYEYLAYSMRCYIFTAVRSLIPQSYVRLYRRRHNKK